jgi:hypothetical protein
VKRPVSRPENLRVRGKPTIFELAVAYCFGRNRRDGPVLRR